MCVGFMKVTIRVHKLLAVHSRPHLNTTRPVLLVPLSNSPAQSTPRPTGMVWKGMADPAGAGARSCPPVRALSSAHAGDAQYEPGMDEFLSLPTCRARHVVCMLATHVCACTYACTAGGSSSTQCIQPSLLSAQHRSPCQQRRGWRSWASKKLP